ncbi:hypothetical protein [Clostridium butyricum]|uniref:hypothetical protein n=1 Tax=Clostridium butyricum TaxID=1492 RepID=UPI00325A53D1
MEKLNEQQFNELYDYLFKKTGQKISTEHFNIFIEKAYKEKHNSDIYSDIKSYIDNVAETFNKQ